MKKCWIVLAILFVCLSLYCQCQTKIIITGIDNNDLKLLIQDRVSVFLTECNKSFFEKKKPDWSDLNLTSKAKEAGIGLWKVRPFYCYETEIIISIVRGLDGDYEVRGLPIVYEAGTDTEDEDELVVLVTPTGLIDGLIIALDKLQYNRMLATANSVRDLKLKQIILNFIENYRTSYNRKDIDYIRDVFSDDALIIVGRIAQKNSKMPDQLGNVKLSSDKVELVRYTKQQYIENLSNCFKKNKFVRIEFANIDIEAHPTVKDIYGVTLKQKWSSSTYNDVGYLFLMIDFKDEEKPIIWVRAWQPDAFTKQEDIISLGDIVLNE